MDEPDEELLRTADARGLHREDLIELIAVLRRDRAALVAERDRLRAGIMAAEVHGELIVRMRESVWKDFVAERDRLRAVVDAARAYQEAMFGLAPGFTIEDLDAQSVQTNAAWQQVREALAQLDVSPAMGDADGIPVGYVHRTGGGYAALPPKEQLIDGVNEFELTPNLSTRFGYCAACEMVYPPDQTHHCSDGTPTMGGDTDG